MRKRFLIVTFVFGVIMVLSAIVITKDQRKEQTAMSTQNQIEQIDEMLDKIDEFIQINLKEE